jgi:hypothetical protein
MSENPRKQWWIFDAGNYPQRALAMVAGLDFDGKDPLEALYSQNWFRSSRAATGR